MKRKIGQVFTPIKWAEWLINKWNIFDAWLDGAHICDPTAGQGAFVIAILNIARKKRVPITPNLLSRITLIEIDPSNIDQFKKTLNQEYSLDFPTDQIFCKDIITQEHSKKYDILIGNPPWVNFVNLPSVYKTRLKSCFIEEGLVQNKQSLLLGSSRVDLAALVTKVVLGKLLKNKGIGCFYLPTSLFFGDGAHIGFRNYRANYRDFAIESVYEFSSTQVFEGINTSYCCALFQMDSNQNFPVPYFKEMGNNWVEQKAFPLRKATDPWRIVENSDDIATYEIPDISLPPEQKPRQGVNTCGANSVFIFDDKPSFLPDQFLFPLATKEIWQQPKATPQKWVLLPYYWERGKPLNWHSISKHETLRTYLQEHQDVLQARKGTLLNASMKRGNWWALLGVGPYSFAPYKVIWEAYGKDHFNPIVISNVDGQMWQGNQAMHAFIPCWCENDAQQVKMALQNPEIPKILRQLNGSGKCNWAQPGKIKKIINFDERQQKLFRE